jgi:hypothetical protein
MAVRFRDGGQDSPSPCCVSVDYADEDRALITVVPHTTELRGSRLEIPAAAPFLKAGAFLVQESLPIRRRGRFADSAF